jgi:hypothetical protein
VDVVDLRADGESADETDYATCQMCGNEKIRYVHIMEHPDLDENFDVGCVCAEKMSGDYEGPKRRENRLRNRAVRRKKWLTRTWRTSSKGNPFLNIQGHNVGVHINKFKRWGYRIEGRFGAKTYPTMEAAKLALFDEFWMATQDNEQLWSND